MYKLYHNDLPNDFILEGDLAIDTETMGLNFHRDKLCLIQISNGDGKAHLVKFSSRNYDAPNLKKLLSDPSSKKIFHFARFDISMIYVHLGIKLENIYCTKIASKLCRTYTDSHGLKELCRELLNKQISKQQQSSDWGSANLSDEQLTYAASDVLYLHKIKEILSSMLARENRTEIAEACFGFLMTRCMIDLEGWPETDIFSHS